MNSFLLLSLGPVLLSDLLTLPGASGQGPFPAPQPYNTPSMCVERGEFFMTGNLTCLPCSEDQLVARDGEDLGLEGMVCNKVTQDL